MDIEDDDLATVPVSEKVQVCIAQSCELSLQDSIDSIFLKVLNAQYYICLFSNSFLISAISGLDGVSEH